jgi:nicotinamide-nucleotide amidase
VLYSRTLKTAGITEGGIDEMLSDLFGKENPYLGIYARTDGIHLRIIARAPSHDEATDLAGPVEAQIRERLGNAIWGTDEETAASRVLGILAAQGRTVGVLEGASAGTVASMFGDLPDPGAAYRGSLAVNQTEALSGATLESLLHAARSIGEETALAMANAARKLLGADIGLGISPRSEAAGGDSDGAIWVGMASDRGHKAVTSRFARGRANSAFRTGMFALIELAAALQAEEL